MIEFRASEGERFDMSAGEWLAFANRTSFHAARARARSMGIDIIWDCEVSKTTDGYYQIQSGIEYAIARSLAVAPFADLLWMETKTANLADARRFAEAIHAEFPSKMLAYNLSPSFNWDTTGMSEAEMRRFPEELGKLGFVFNFITYGGHQIDGLAAEEFATALKQDGMLSLARLQRKFRLVESPYRTPQTLVGGPRLDAALMASSGGTAATKAMGKGSTQHQHLVQTEVPTKLLEQWLAMWTKYHQIPGSLRVGLRPHTAGSELLELTLSKTNGEKVANIIFDVIVDRRGRNILSVRDQNTFDIALRKKRLMTLNHLFLVHRYKIWSVHYVSPTDDNRYQAQKMSTHGLFSDVHDEVGDVIVADVSADGVKALLAPDRDRLNALIQRKYPYTPADVAAQDPAKDWPEREDVNLQPLRCSPTRWRRSGVVAQDPARCARPPPGQPGKHRPLACHPAHHGFAERTTGNSPGRPQPPSQAQIIPFGINSGREGNGQLPRITARRAFTLTGRVTQCDDLDQRCQRSSPSRHGMPGLEVTTGRRRMSTMSARSGRQARAHLIRRALCGRSGWCWLAGVWRN